MSDPSNLAERLASLETKVEGIEEILEKQDVLERMASLETLVKSGFESITAGIKAINDRLDKLNGKTSRHAEDLIVLKGWMNNQKGNCSDEMAKTRQLQHDVDSLKTARTIAKSWLTGGQVIVNILVALLSAFVTLYASKALK